MIRTSNISTGNKGGIVITHREFLTDILPTVAFTKQDFSLNPGLISTCPWLSELAQNYEEYEIRGMVFEYRSLAGTSTNVAGTMGLGSVIMATNYNPYNDPFVDKRTMENYDGCTSKRPSDSFIHVIDVKKASTPIPGLKWVRKGAVPQGADTRLYDVGKFSIATVGQPSDVLTGNIGELWVAYEIEFFKPKFSGATGSNLLLDHYSFSLPGDFNQGWTVAHPFGATSGLVPNFIRGNKMSHAGTTLSTVDTDGTTCQGYDTINFDDTHIGMTFMIIVAYRGVTGVTSGGNGLAQLNKDPGGVPDAGFDDILGFDNQTQPLAYNEDGIVTASSNNIFKIKIVGGSGSTPGTNVHFFLSNGHSIFPDGTMDIYVMQINGTSEF